MDGRGPGRWSYSTPPRVHVHPGYAYPGGVGPGYAYGYGWDTPDGGYAYRQPGSTAGAPYGYGYSGPQGSAYADGYAPPPPSPADGAGTVWVQPGTTVTIYPGTVTTVTTTETVSGYEPAHRGVRHYATHRRPVGKCDCD